MPFENAILATAVLAIWASGVPWAAFGLAAGAARRLSPPLWCALLAGLAFAIDTLRSAFAVTFPWALVGHTQASVPGVAQLALVGGVPLVSALVVALSAAAAALLASRGKVTERRGALPAFAVVLGAYAALALLGLPLAVALRGTLDPPTSPAVSVLVVQPNLHPRERWHPRVQRTNLAIVAAESARALETSPADLVVWPENTLTTPPESDPVLAEELRTRVGALGVPVVLGAVREGDLPERQRTSALWVAPGRGIVDAVDKTRAIPLVETSAAAWPLRGVERLLGAGPERRLVAEGHEERPLRGAYELVPALCYEILFPGLVAARRTDASAAILNLGNDSWFLSAAPSGHQIAIASFRAIEQRLFVVRAVHGGASAVLDPFGRVVESLRFGQRGSLAARILPQAPPHPIERAGLAALALAGGGFGLLVSFTLFGRKVP
jgi:apolipoprotein N-acyltransferase